MAGVRMTVVWCPDWPVVSWGVPLDEPAAVLVANRVVASTPAARDSGVALGQRRRDAQSRCPELAILERDIDREARLFEPVAAALDEITPRVEVTGPGLVGFPTRGPSRFFGGDETLVEKTVELIQPVLPRRVPVRVAIADGVFAARLAARAAVTVTQTPDERSVTQTPDERSVTQTPDERSVAQGLAAVRVIEPGKSPEFLADLPIGTLEMPELVEVFVRLGLTTLGALAELSAADIVGRFGSEGRLAHRLARGDDDHPPDLRRPAPDLAATWVFEPPADTIERCAFAAKTLADELHHDLLTQGLSCTRVAIEAETESGERQMRLWRHQGALSAAALADRARWQLDGWLNQGENSRPSSGVVRLTLIPDEVVAASGRQLGLWGSRNDRSEDVTRVVARLQALLGPDSVTVPEFRGGVAPSERLRMVPAAVVDLSEERAAASRHWVDAPWPGQIPPPSPARIHPDPLPIELFDSDRRSIGVNGRGELSGKPQLLAGAPSAAGRLKITYWAGPWPADQRWWDPLTRRRRARLQVVLEDRSAHLLVIEQQCWSIEATYD